ncbi:MAG: hypothetical protein HY700_09690 [Gemmatimonadetes bacterium]|nr:hypothetical protein [Gemmatimonadota bacterium]
MPTLLPDRERVLPGGDVVAHADREKGRVPQTDAVLDATQATGAGLKPGCYLMTFQKTGSSNIFDGTLRVQRVKKEMRVSGDMYLRGSAGAPSPPGGIPSLPAQAYCYHIQANNLSHDRGSGDLRLGFSVHEHIADDQPWKLKGQYTAVLQRQKGGRSPQFAGEVFAGTVAFGHLALHWVSRQLRRAILEIDKISSASFPTDNGEGVSWSSVFKAMGWDLRTIQSNKEIEDRKSWSLAELHKQMLENRLADPPSEGWHYYLLCVGTIEDYDRGVMWDGGGSDSKKLLRGAFVSTTWQIPPAWGALGGKLYGSEKKPYFRSAVHEVGHAMGLLHGEPGSTFFMNTTDSIAENNPEQFPDNIKWSFAERDQRRLAHLPDIRVMPSAPWTESYPRGDLRAAENARGLRLHVVPLLNEVPLGAPVRLRLTLENTTGAARRVPSSLGMRAGHVGGTVTGPSGEARPFKSIFLCLDKHETQVLEPGSSISEDLTLLRGGKGALFWSAGPHRIEVEATWEDDHLPMQVTGSTEVVVTEPQTETHAAAARRVLDEPDTLLVLAIGGDHLEDGIGAVRQALEDETLRPHFAVIEAKRLGRPFFERQPEIERLTSLIDESALMSSSEAKRLAELARTIAADAGQAAVESLVGVLVRKAEAGAFDESVGALIRSLLRS